MKLHAGSLALGGLAVGLVGLGIAVFGERREPPSPVPVANDLGVDAGAATEPRPAAEPERVAAPQSPAREPVRDLRPDTLRTVLRTTRSRLEQVQAIMALLADGSAEARQALLDSFLAADDKVLLVLLEEALLESAPKMTPSLMDAFQGARDPEQLDRLANLLRHAAASRPELTEPVVAFLIRALDAPGDPQSGAAVATLRALGPAAVEQLAAHLREPRCGPEAAGSVADILAKLPPDCGPVLRDKVTQGFAATRDVLGDPQAVDADKELARKKTGSLAWAASSRPPAEHDGLASVLADELGRSVDQAQAGTLAWGLKGLGGLTDAGRTRTASALLGSLVQQQDTNVRRILGGSVAQLASSGGAGVRDAVGRQIEAAQARELDPKVAEQLRRLRAELEAGAGK